MHDPTKLETVEQLADKLFRRVHNGAVDATVRQWAAEQLRANQADLDLVLRGDEGYQEFLLKFIAEQREQYQLADAVDTPYDSVRETPLCTCDDIGCALKRGKLPIQVRTADDTGRALVRFRQAHNGDPLVLDHDGDPQGARQAWSEKRGDVYVLLRRLHIFTSTERDEPPTEEELARIDAGAQLVEAD